MAVKLWWHKTDYSAMQWPAPSGFHVPLRDEWVALCLILTSTFGMASNATTMGTYLKMPMAGYRYSSSSNVGSLGSLGRYWSSMTYSAGNAYCLRFNSSSLDYQYGGSCSYGQSVRCFKDAPVTPDSSWTEIFRLSWAPQGMYVWIYHNSSLWLISVSWDGIIWYTIQDKNLGATTVYNQWDTLTDANCWYFYQRGNNYGFAHSGTITTSSTQVDASSYWPWNYYNSSTFITWSTDRSSVQNDNLRWWVTWIRPWELQAAYIGEFIVHPVSQTFTYTWSDQTWTVPYTQDYVITAKWAWSRTSSWWLWQWIFSLTAWDVLTIVVWQNWGSQSSVTYWFGWSSNYSSDRAGGGLSWVFTWSWTVQATDSARALVIGWGAGWWKNTGQWGVWWWETGWTWTWSFWTPWEGWSQTWHWATWNKWANQFNWWNWSWTYWYGGWGWWRWGNSSIWDGSWDDDKWGWGWSGYVLSTATNRILTQWWWAAAWNNWEVTIISVS